MSIITRKLTLVGAYRGQTVALKAGDNAYEFTEGSLTITGPQPDVDNLSRFLGRCYQAYPDLSPELDAALAAIHGGEDAAETDEGTGGSDGLQPGGTDDDAGGAADQAPVPTGSGEDGAGDGDAPTGGEEHGSADQGDGQGPLVAALKQLDPNDDEHWTADGKPKMTAVEALMGRSDITRAQVNEALPGFNREAARG